MSNLFLELPVPAGNGPGTAIDVSSMGGTKTIVVAGTSSSTINVEFNNAADSDTGSWQSLFTVQGGGSITVAVAARWMRARVSNFSAGTTDVHVGATSAGTQFAELDVPAGNGNGGSVDVSGLLGLLKTVQVGGKFKGVLLVEVSVDGDEWAQPFSFSQPGAQSLTIVAHLMRVRRTGIIGTDIGAPVVNVGATTTGEGGGGNSTSTLQVFEYVVTGVEPDLSELEISLPTAITGDYGVMATCQGATNIVAFDIPDDLKSSSTFTAIATGELAAGDVICFFAAPKTIQPT